LERINSNNNGEKTLIESTNSNAFSQWTFDELDQERNAKKHGNMMQTFWAYCGAAGSERHATPDEITLCDIAAIGLLANV
jgi:hypothetical protein